MGTGPLSEMWCSLEYRMMDKVQKPINPDYQNSSKSTLLEVSKEVYLEISEKTKTRSCLAPRIQNQETILYIVTC
jgi:hypothetical protein